jgi:Fe-S cluster assembly iron-binding protein IscA
MALDEPKENDEIIKYSGFSVAADKELLKQTGGVKVDYLSGPFRKGFSIKSQKDTCGSCSC